MEQVHHRHTQPLWYSLQRTLTHGTSASQTHIAHVVQSAADSHAWDKCITDAHSPCGTVRSGLSCMGQVHHRHTAYAVICIQHKSSLSPTNTTKTIYLQVVLYSTPSSPSHYQKICSLLHRFPGGKLRWDRLRLRNVFPDWPPEKLLRKEQERKVEPPRIEPRATGIPYHCSAIKLQFHLSFLLFCHFRGLQM